MDIKIIMGVFHGIKARQTIPRFNYSWALQWWIEAVSWRTWRASRPHILIIWQDWELKLHLFHLKKYLLAALTLRMAINVKCKFYRTTMKIAFIIWNNLFTSYPAWMEAFATHHILATRLNINHSYFELQELIDKLSQKNQYQFLFRFISEMK